MLKEKIGNFKHSFGCRTSDEFKEETKFELENRGEQGFKDWVEDWESYSVTEKGKLFSLYDYKDGGLGSVYVELTPYLDGDELSLYYVVYEEYNGNSRECGSIIIGEEERLISVLEDTIIQTTKDFEEMYND